MNSPIAEPVRLHGPKSAVERRTITAEEAGQRIDNFLMRHFKTVPRSRVYRLLRKGEVRVNRKRVEAEYRIAAGDEVRLPPVRIDADAQPGRPSTSLLELIEGAVIFQDKHLLVLDKPAGVAVHGGSGLSHGIIEALRASRPRETLELVHRLDRDTSGCLLVARDRATLTALHALIRNGGVHKTYLALVSGSWQLGTKRIDVPLSTDNRQHGERHVRVAAAGKDSVSVFKPVQFFGPLATLMEVDIPTGRTHQIRVHASFAGHPLLGDDKYGDVKRNAELKQRGLKRTFLHAQSVAFEWPGSGMPFHVSAPLPVELSAVLDAITPMKRKPPKGNPNGNPKANPKGNPQGNPEGAAKTPGGTPKNAMPEVNLKGNPMENPEGAPWGAVPKGNRQRNPQGAPRDAMPSSNPEGAPQGAVPKKYLKGNLEGNRQGAPRSTKRPGPRGRRPSRVP